MYVCDHILVTEKEPLMLGLKELWTGNIPYFHLTDDTKVKECILSYVLPVFPDHLRPLGIDSSLLVAICRACWEKPDKRPEIDIVEDRLHELNSSRLSPTLVCVALSRRMHHLSYPYADCQP